MSLGVCCIIEYRQNDSRGRDIDDDGGGISNGGCSFNDGKVAIKRKDSGSVSKKRVAINHSSG